MRFLIIVVCLLSDKFMPHQLQAIRKSWLEYYTNAIRKITPPSFLNASPLSLYAIVLTSLILVCSISYSLKSISILFMLNFLFELSVFYLCLGEHNLFYMNTNSSEHLSIREYIYAINQEVVAVSLWFFLFGPVGALIYRVTLEFAKIQTFEKTIVQLCQILDWLPTRITALLFLMVGQFQPGFSSYMKLFCENPEQNHLLLATMAEHALQEKTLEKIEVARLEGLYSHACLLLLFIMAVFMIGKII
jgi:AmpE protein